MGKKKKRKRQRHVSDTAAETDPGLRAAYFSDPIALWQDGEYGALDALYAQPDKEHTDGHVEPKPSETGVAQDEDDSLPF